MYQAHQAEAKTAAKIERIRARLAAEGTDVEQVLRDTDAVRVAYVFNVDGTEVHLLRQVWNKAYRVTDRHCLFEQRVAEFDSYGAQEAVSALVVAYGSACEAEGARYAVSG